MATQSTALTIGNNAEAARESTRKLVSFDKHALPAYRFFGEGNDKTIAEGQTTDYNVPSKSAADELGGINSSTAVPTKTTVPTKYFSPKQNYVIDAETIFSIDGAGVPGQLGDISVQETQLMLRSLKAIDTLLVSNQASRLEGDANTPARTVCPMTGLGDGSENLATNPGIMSVATTTNLTNAGGYNASTRVTASIDDDTTAANRGNLKINDLARAAVRIYKNLDTSMRASGKGGMSKDTTMAAFIPVDAFQNLFNADNAGIASQTRFNTVLGGKMTQITAHVVCIQTTVCKLMLYPVVTQIGGGSDNEIALVMAGTGTRVIYHTRQDTERIPHRVNRIIALRMAFALEHPEPLSGIAIIGIKKTN